MVVRSALTLILTWNLTKISVLAFQSWALTEVLTLCPGQVEVCFASFAVSKNRVRHGVGVFQ